MSERLILEPLAEYQRVTVPAPPPSPADLRLAQRLSGTGGEPRLTVRWLVDGQIEIVSTSWVGVVQFSGVEIRVVPKLAGGDLGVLRMLAYTTDLDMLRSLPDQSLPGRGENLFDLLCLLLTEETHRVLRDGLLRDYRSVAETTEVVRGRLRYRDQLLRRFGQLDQLECQFDEHDSDVPENQFVAAALLAARRQVTDPWIRRQVGRFGQILNEASAPQTIDPGWYRSRITYNRRNERYRIAHNLSELVLRNLAFEDLFTPSSQDVSAFLLDMNELFERFVTKLITEAAVGSTIRVDAQASLRAVIRNDLTGRTYAAIRPDLIVEDRVTARRTPIDIKYKRYDLRKISTADIYQTFLYAYALQPGHGQARAGLLYPTLDHSSEHRLSVRDGTGTTGAHIVATGLNIPEILDQLDGDGDTRDECYRAILGITHELLEDPATSTTGRGTLDPWRGEHRQLPPRDLKYRGAEMVPTFRPSVRSPHRRP